MIPPRTGPSQRSSVPAAERGETLVSILAALMLAGLLLAGMMSVLLNTSRLSLDHEEIAKTEERARNVLQLIAFDARMAGSGMPLGQSFFAIGGSGLGNAPLPLLTTATATSFTIRANELGVSTVLTAAYTPAPASLSFAVLSADDLAPGNAIYLSDMPAGGSNGLLGTIQSINGTTVTIRDTYVTSAGAQFAAGSTVDRVTSIAYSSPASGAGVTRDDGFGALLLEPQSRFSADYLDGTGAVLPLPLTEAAVRDSLSALRLTVTVASSRPLVSGQTYTATATQTVALRNLNLNRN